MAEQIKTYFGVSGRDRGVRTRAILPPSALPTDGQTSGVTPLNPSNASELPETLFSRPMDGVFLVCQSLEKLRAAWSLFTPCSPMDSLLKATQEAARSAAPGDVFPLPSACSGFDLFQNYQHRGGVFRPVVRSRVEAVGHGLSGNPEPRRTPEPPAPSPF
jgi:hypothetical protein